MKVKRYQDIKASNRTNFTMVYYHAGRTLTQIETLLKNAYGNPLPTRPQNRLNRLRFKLEQMVARYKQCEDELKTEYSSRKKK
ncbi:MAG: hypothetical protein SO314_06200 [Alphaproteobacteria bacterium]|nr:hypothetical protein [Alphaproteobacteria bacterium]